MSNAIKVITTPKEHRRILFEHARQDLMRTILDAITDFQNRNETTLDEIELYADKAGLIYGIQIIARLPKNYKEDTQ